MPSNINLYVIERKPCDECNGAKAAGLFCSVCNGSGEIEREIPFEEAVDRLISQHPRLEAVARRMCG